MKDSRLGSRKGSKEDSASEPTPKPAENSTAGSNWRQKFTENVRLSNSKPSPRKRLRPGNPTGTSAEQHSADSENKD